MADGPLKSLFNSLNQKDNAKSASEIGGGDAPKKQSNKRLSVERIYQKKSQLEHILLRPDTYIGSVEMLKQSMWIMEESENTMIQKEITFVPGLYKIFDEILVNAADNKQRDPDGMTCIKIDIDPENNKVKIWNNGKGIPVVEHKEEKMYVPTLIFGHLLTSSNYDDAQKKVTGGRNGYGAKLCNIFSTKFVVETSSKSEGKAFKQTWRDNMQKTMSPTITDAKGSDFTCVTFYPDLEKFKMSSLDPDIVALFTRRAYDIAAAAKGVKVFLNGKKLPVSNFRAYVDLFIKDKTDDTGQPLKIVHEIANDRWEIAVTMSEKGFQQASFVNSIATTKGGRHVDYIADQIISKLIEIVRKKNKGGVNIKPFQVKNHLWVFVNCLIENPTFDSQTKENMTLQSKNFGSKCSLSEKFIQQASKCGLVESILSWMKFKAQSQLEKKCTSSKHSKLKGIPKLDDANDAGTKNSHLCTLILTEGDSAKSLAVAGLGVIGRDRYGVFPLRGKLLNVREASHKQIMDNAEINNVIKIMGLKFKEKYENLDAIKTLRYGKVMIMTDQDQDGSHIKGLFINFIHHFWPSLLKQKVLEEFITPIVKATKGNNSRSFYSLPEFEEWKQETDNWHTWKIKYYKGLGTSTSKEAKEYFSEMDHHRVPFKYDGTEDDASINLAFSKKKIEERKEWLSNWMESKKQRSEMGLPEEHLYGTTTSAVTYNEFINKELILFSNMDNVRSIPSLVDGLKPGQRKVMFTCFKRNLVKELKVAQLAGSVAELSAYHHGESSLMSTIINLAQSFVGSNNINLLLPNGQFGTRLHGGKDAASPRYIFTALSSVSRLLYNAKDDPLLDFLSDDNLKIEPVWYCPIIPMVLVNGAEGIGTGWSTKISNYDPREIIANLKRMLDGLEPHDMIPSFKNFKGTIEELSDSRYCVSGEVSVIDDQTIEITELPIRVWTQNYKEDVLEPMLHGTEKTPSMIVDYKEYHTDATVKFVIKMLPEKLAQAEASGLHRVFKLQNTLSTSTMVLFDPNGCIKRYDKVEEILKEFYTLRLDLYVKRKAYLEGMLAAESLKFDNIARFIMEKCDGIIIVENKPKKELIQILVRRGYDSDPTKAWKEAQNKLQEAEDGENEEEQEESKSGPDYNYILGMPIWNLTKEKKEELCKQRDKKREELNTLQEKSPSVLWKEDLEEFLVELDKVEQLEKEEQSNAANIKGKSKNNKVKARKAAPEIFPSPVGRRIAPRVDTDMKMKAQKNIAMLNRKKEKKKLKFEDDDIKVEVPDEPKSLAERLKLGGGSKNSSKPTNNKTITEMFKNKESEKSDKKKSKEKTEKKKKLDDSENISDEEPSFVISDDSESEAYSDNSFIIPTKKEAKKSKKATEKPKEKAVKKKRFSESDDESFVVDDKALDDDEDDESFAPAPRATKRNAAQKKYFDDSEESDDEDDYVPEKQPDKKKSNSKTKETKEKSPSPPSSQPTTSDVSDLFATEEKSQTSSLESQPVILDSDTEEIIPKPKSRKLLPKEKPLTMKGKKKEDNLKQQSIMSALTKNTESKKSKAEEKPKKVQKSTAAKTKQPKKKAKVTADSDSDLSDEAPSKKRSAKMFDSDSDEGDYIPKKKKVPTATLR